MREEKENKGEKGDREGRGLLPNLLPHHLPHPHQTNKLQR